MSRKVEVPNPLDDLLVAKPGLHKSVALARRNKKLWIKCQISKVGQAVETENAKCGVFTTDCNNARRWSLLPEIGGLPSLDTCSRLGLAEDGDVAAERIGDERVGEFGGEIAEN